MSILEIIASLVSIIAVFLTVKQKIICFPIGIISVILYVYIFYESKLYADMSLQVFYVIMLLYGWYNWIFGKKDSQLLKVTRLPLKLLPIYAFIILFLSAFLGFILNKFTDASLPYIDAFTTVLSLFAQWLVARKIIENWIIWIIADSIYIGMYLYKDLYSTSILYLIFIILAVKGLIDWKNDLQAIKK